MRRKVVITNQDTFIEWNLTRIIKSFYPLLDDLPDGMLEVNEQETISGAYYGEGEDATQVKPMVGGKSKKKTLKRKGKKSTLKKKKSSKICQKDRL